MRSKKELACKRFKPESSINTEVKDLYLKYNNHYLKDGINQYTLQFVRKMSNLCQCIYLPYYSLSIYSFENIFFDALYSKITPYE